MKAAEEAAGSEECEAHRGRFGDGHDGAQGVARVAHDPVEGADVGIFDGCSGATISRKAHVSPDRPPPKRR